MKMKEFGPPGGAHIPGAPLGSAMYLLMGFIDLVGIRGYDVLHYCQLATKVKYFAP